MASQISTRTTKDLSIYRILLVLAAILVPCYWIVYNVTHPGAVDPLWLRLGIGGLALGIAGVTYTDWGRSHLILLYRGYIYLLAAWVLLLNVWNGFSFDYALGLFFVVTVTAIGFNAGLRRMMPLVRYLLFTVVASVGVLMIYPDPQVDRAVFITYLMGLPLILYPVSRWRLNVEQNLRSNEERFHVLTNSTFEGLLIMENAVVIDCNKRAAEMFACSSKEELIGRPIETLIAPEDIEQVYARNQTNQHDHYRTRGQRLSGEVFPGEVHAQPMPYYGRTVRVAAIRDLTEQIKREEQLRAAKDKAEEMNRLKSAFLANMSHEIRTPLTSILGFAEILHEEVPDKNTEFVQLIQRSGKRLLETLDSVLDLAQLEAKSLELDPTEFEITQQLSETVELFEPRAREKDIRLKIDVPAHAVPVELDKKAFDRIVSNLLSNAIKFTESGYVQITLRNDEEQVLLQIEDTGKGIRETFISRLFDAFKQESSGLTRDHQGTGLGLTITKQIVSLMQGTITVGSTPGEGSTFTVTLPRRITTTATAGLTNG